MGTGNRSAIGTLVERQARFLILIHIPAAHTAVSVRDGIATAVTDLPPTLRRTLTWDQGKEMALHQQTTALTGSTYPSGESGFGSGAPGVVGRAS